MPIILKRLWAPLDAPTMIVRAVDDDDDASPPVLGNTAVRVLWVSATSLATLLCMLDLSSLFSRSNFTSSIGLLSFLHHPWRFDAVAANLVTGYLFVCLWIFSREGLTSMGILWCVLQMLFGNVVMCIYIVFVLFHTNGDWRRFWLGQTRTCTPSTVQKLDRFV
jgi:hypothetical protein